MPTANALVVLFCATCRGDVTFEQLADCLDGHTDCPEWVCVDCGDAVLLGFASPERVVRAHPTSHVA